MERESGIRGTHPFDQQDAHHDNAIEAGDAHANLVADAQPVGRFDPLAIHPHVAGAAGCRGRAACAEKSHRPQPTVHTRRFHGLDSMRQQRNTAEVVTHGGHDYSCDRIPMKRRTFLIGSVSGLSLAALAACATPRPPAPSPSSSESPPQPPDVPPVPHPERFVRSSWGSDAHSLGAWSVGVLGAAGAARSALAQPAGERLFFAGEATSVTHPGTVGGARATGVRAAAEVREHARPGERIVVVGAGVAGVTAAQILAAAGHRVVVVEGRDRAGGRIHSLADGTRRVPLPLGATEVASADAPLLSVLSFHDIAIADTPGGVDRRTLAGGSQVVSDASRAFHPDDDHDSLDTWVLGNFSNICDLELADVDVLPSSTVSAIVTGERGVSLRLARGESLSADRVVVTVPLGVLKSGAITFDPPLPEGHRDALDALTMVQHERVVLRFSRPFWSSTEFWWEVADPRARFSRWINLEPLTGQAVLIGIAHGAAAHFVSAGDDDEVLAEALRCVKPFVDPNAAARADERGGDSREQRSNDQQAEP